MNRRTFLESSAAAGVATTLAAVSTARGQAANDKISICMMGVRGRGGGVLSTFASLPDVEVRLWPSNVDNGVDEMLTKRFPKLKIIKGRDDILAALKECDFLLHGSGPGFVAHKDVAKWHKETGKPYGI